MPNLTGRGRGLIGVVCVLVFAAALSAQSPRAQSRNGESSALFTVDDMLEVVNVSVADLSDDGRWVAATATALRDRIGIDNARFADPTYIAPSNAELLVIDTQSGATQKVFPTKRQVRGETWSPDGNFLAMLVLEGETYRPAIWERTSGELRTLELPKEKLASENASLEWSPDGSQLVFSVRPVGWWKEARGRFQQETAGRIVVQSSKEPFLDWEAIRRLPIQRSLIAYDLKTNSAREVLPEMKLSTYSLSEDGSFLSYAEDVTKKTDYDVIFGTDTQVLVRPYPEGQPRTIVKSTKGISLIWSRDGRTYAYSKDGNLFFASIEDKEPRQLTGKKAEKASPAADEKRDEPKDGEKKTPEKFTAVRLSPSGSQMVASSKDGLWLVDTASGARDLFLKLDSDDKEAPRYSVVDWSPDGRAIFLSYESRTQWERGLARYDLPAKKLEELNKGAKLQSGFRLSKDGRTIVFASADGNHPTDLFAAGSDFKNVRRLTNANPQLAKKSLSKTELIAYLDADGNKLRGVLYYPANYEHGKKYPAVFNIYEQFFDDTYNGTINVLTAHGYAVMQPSVSLEIGHPGEAWIKGVTAAANKLIEMGIADPDRLGVQGTSYGGYATNLLITQTQRFKAAVNISGKVDMISFYTDSPRFGVRNIHAPEKSQDRIGATLWQQPQKYIDHSAIFFADRIKTPLLLITGELDPNVPARQAMEMYYALRRLGKEVTWVSYTYGDHGMPTTTVDEVKDYHQRIVSWYDEHLKGSLKKRTDEEPENR